MNNIDIKDRVNIKDYKYVKDIAKGGFGHVMEYEKNGQSYAVKKVGKKYKDELIEIILLNEFNHPNIIKPVDFAKDDKSFYILMKEGVDVIHAVKLATQEEKWGLIRDIANGVLYMHLNGYIHGDLKTFNVIVLDDTAKLIDLGYSSSKKYPQWDGYGTMSHRAPEFFTDKDRLRFERNIHFVEQKQKVSLAESWSLGVLIAEIFLGRFFFPLDPIGKINEYLDNPQDYVAKNTYSENEEENKEICDIILALCHPSVEKRMKILALFSTESFKKRGLILSITGKKIETKKDFFPEIKKDFFPEIKKVIRWMSSVHSAVNRNHFTFCHATNMFYLWCQNINIIDETFYYRGAVYLLLSSVLNDDLLEIGDILEYFCRFTDVTFNKDALLQEYDKALLCGDVLEKHLGHSAEEDKKKVLEIIDDPVIFYSKNVTQHLIDLQKKDNSTEKDNRCVLC